MSGMNILVVEDDESWQKAIQHALRKLPVECSLVIAPDFECANERLDRESFDLVTLDMALDQMEEEPGIPGSGWVLIDRLKEEFPETHIIVISGSKGFQERPDRVAELLTEYSIVKFLWKGDVHIQVELRKAVASILQPKNSEVPEHFGKSDLVSIRSQLTTARENLRLIHERKSQYVVETDIPLQLIKEEQHLLERVEKLEQWFEELNDRIR
jgi:CheY-like chemotaxis protein